MSVATARADLLTHLRDEIAARERTPTERDLSATPTGWPALDRLLPLGGIRRGALIELLDGGLGCGAETVAAVLTRAACRNPGVVAVVDPAGEFYPPALAAWGVPFDRLVVVRPTTDADALWAADQALRSRAAVAVWLWRERLAAHDFRRLQLSAEEGGAVGVLIRPARVCGQPTCADVQLAVEPQVGTWGRRLRLTVTRCRGRTPGSVAEIEFDDQGTPHAPREEFRSSRGA
jgi:protein ImuA